MANRLGPAALGRLAAEAPPAQLARAAWMASAVFGLEPICDAIDAAPAPAATRLEALLALRRLQEYVARDLLAAPELDQPLDAAIAALQPGIAALSAAAATDAAGSAAAATLRDAGLPGPLAAFVAASPFLGAAPAIVRLAASTGVEPAAAAKSWQSVGQTLGFDGLRTAVATLPIRGGFGARARAVLLSDLASAQLRLAKADIGGASALPAAAAAQQLARDAVVAPDLAGLTVATRAFVRPGRVGCWEAANRGQHFLPLPLSGGGWVGVRREARRGIASADRRCAPDPTPALPLEGKGEPASAACHWRDGRSPSWRSAPQRGRRPRKT